MSNIYIGIWVTQVTTLQNVVLDRSVLFVLWPLDYDEYRLRTSEVNIIIVRRHQFRHFQFPVCCHFFVGRYHFYYTRTYPRRQTSVAKWTRSHLTPSFLFYNSLFYSQAPYLRYTAATIVKLTYVYRYTDKLVFFLIISKQSQSYERNIENSLGE